MMIVRASNDYTPCNRLYQQALRDLSVPAFMLVLVSSICLYRKLNAGSSPARFRIMLCYRINFLGLFFGDSAIYFAYRRY
ncbi:hypothetical protein BJ878DRAFT_491246 [Calycina marina]|uniref:Uncharacterized protein n=1 Tax=Calycina marina TaxID=1763456 RepID=A0A9P8CHY3_9HELO|nr:hypothetical protein BJ878DRAFT_491246 [Calycina marina]